MSSAISSRARCSLLRTPLSVSVPRERSLASSAAIERGAMKTTRLPSGRLWVKG